jgi:DNA processing protein
MISAPPPVLYALGDSDLLVDLGREEQQESHRPFESGRAAWWFDGESSHPFHCPDGPPCFAVVGSRRPTEYGRTVARRLGRSLAAAGGVVVSGLARGIDAQAHAGALEVSGRTVAVLGGGLALQAYPRENRGLAGRIARCGLLLSEFPLETTPRPEQFPRRNRIIVGLAVSVAVIEAAGRSGALITARLALEEGREVFAVPGRITDPVAAGTNGLLRAGAAAVLTREQDMIDELAPQWRERLAVQTGAPGPGRGCAPAADGLSATEQGLIRLLRADEPTPVDLLVSRSDRPAGEVLAALVGLEIRGLIRSIPGGRYLLPP